MFYKYSYFTSAFRLSKLIFPFYLWLFKDIYIFKHLIDLNIVSFMDLQYYSILVSSVHFTEAGLAVIG